MSEELPQPEQESREITTTETLDQLLGSGIVAFVSKDGEHLPVFEGRWESLPSSLGTFFEGLDAYLENKELGTITTINIFFGKKNQRTELEGTLPYGMILTRKSLSDLGTLVALNFTQYNIDGKLLKNLLDDSSDLFDQFLNFFPQCEIGPKIELIQFLRPVVVDAFREGHLKEIVQQTTGSVHYMIEQELIGDMNQLPWGMGGARFWNLKSMRGSDEQTVPPLVTFILDQLDQFNMEFNKYMSVQDRQEFLEQIIETAFEYLKTFVGTPFMWLEQVEKTVNAIQYTTNQEKRILDFFRNELKRYIAKVTVPSIITIYTEMLHEKKGLDTEFEHIDAFGAYLQQSLVDALDVGALVPEDPRIYVSTQISSIWTEFRKNFGISSRGAFSGLITQTLESIRTFDLPQIVLDSGYLLNSVTNTLIQWSRGVHKKISNIEKQLVEKENVLQGEQKDLDERHQILSDRKQALDERQESLSSEQEQLNSQENVLNDEKNMLNNRESELNTEKTALEAERQAILQANQELADTAEHLAAETQQLAEQETTSNTEKVTLERKLQTVIANQNKFTAEKQTLENQQDALIGKESTLTTDKDELERQLSALTAYREGLTGEDEKLKEQFQSLIASYESLITEKQTLEHQISSLTEQKSSISVKKGEIEQQLQKLADNPETLADEKSPFEDEFRTLTAQESALTAQIEEIEQKLASLTAEENKLVTKKVHLEEQQKSVNANQDPLNTEKVELERQFGILNKNQDSFAIEKARLADQLQRAETQIESINTQHESLTKQVQEIDAKLKTISERRKVLDSKVETLERERGALDERSSLFNTREDTWNTNIAKLQEEQNQWSHNFETFQNEKLELEQAFSTFKQDKNLLDDDYNSWNGANSNLLDKKNKLEQEKIHLEHIQNNLEKYIEFLGQKIDQEFGEILVYEMRKIRDLTRKFRTQFPTYFEEISNSGRAERVGEEWTVKIFEELPNEYEITCEFEELKEHMKYWASPVGGIYPQRIEIFFTDSYGERTGDALFMFQNQNSRFSKQIGAVMAKEKSDGDQLLRNIRDRCRQILTEHDSGIQKEVGE